MKNVLFAMMIGLVGVFASGCGSSACDDLQACCDALAADIEGYSCPDYSEADDDACQAAIDAIQPVEGADLPAECNFE